MATRRERVLLELEDHFTSGMIKAAGAAKLLDRELDGLDKTTVRTTADIDKTTESTKSVGDETQKTSRKTREYTAEMALADEKAARLRKTLRDQAKATLDAGTEMERAGFKTQSTGKQIDKLSGRLNLLAEAAFVLGPALVPLGAAMVPALSGLTMGFTVAAAAAGTAVLAFNGVGASLKALDAYQLEPTKDNLAKMRIEFDKLGPAGAHFVRYLDSIEPQLRSLQMAARQGLFPGVEDGISHLLTMLPQVRTIISSLATELGNLASDAGAGLSGPGFADFFDYLQTDAAPTLEAFGHSIGNLAEGFAHLMVAFAPLTRSFSSGMESMTASFADWAAGLSQTDGFRDFVDYIHQSGPQAAEFLGALSSAFVGIIRAAAPVGEVVLPILTALANVLGAIASSPIGPPLYSAAAALLVINRVATLATGSMTKMGVATEATAAASTTLAGALKTVGLVLGGMAVVDQVQTKFKGLRTGIEGVTAQLLALSDAGGGSKLSGEFGDFGGSLSRLIDPNAAQAFQDSIYSTMGFLGSDSRVDKAKAQVEALDAALSNIASTDGAPAAKRAFDALAQSLGLNLTEQQALYDLLPGFADALAGAGNSAHRHAKDIRDMGAAADYSKSQIAGLVTAMQKQRQEALAGFDAETSYRQALKDAGKQAAKNNAGIRGSSKAALENRGALSQLIGAWNAQSDAVKNNIGKFAEARGAFIRTAIAMGVPRKAAQDLADKYMEIPRSVITHVSTITGTALSALAQLRREFDALDGKTATTWIQTVHVGAGGQAGGYKTSADGGSVPKTGMSYADRHPYLLADGEEVISNRYGQADRHRDLLKAINSNRLADGGTVARYASAARSNGVGHPSGGSSRVEHIVTVRVTGDMDLSRAKAQIREIASDVSRGEVAADRAMGNSIRRQGVPSR